MQIKKGMVKLYGYENEEDVVYKISDNNKVRPTNTYLDFIIEKAKLCKLEKEYVKSIQELKISQMNHINCHQLEPHFYN